MAWISLDCRQIWFLLERLGGGRGGGGDETAAPAESDSCSGLFKLEMPEEKREVSGESAVTRVKCV